MKGYNNGFVAMFKKRNLYPSAIHTDILKLNDRMLQNNLKLVGMDGTIDEAGLVKKDNCYCWVIGVHCPELPGFVC